MQNLSMDVDTEVQAGSDGRDVAQKHMDFHPDDLS